MDVVGWVFLALNGAVALTVVIGYLIFEEKTSVLSRDLSGQRFAMGVTIAGALLGGLFAPQLGLSSLVARVVMFLIIALMTVGVLLYFRAFARAYPRRKN